MTIGVQALVGVFNETSQAEDAIEQLHNAGIPDHQISYSGHTANNGFLATIKSLFTGEDTSAAALLNDLTNMGLSQDEAQYYADQHQAGRAIVAVNPGDRLLQAQAILNSNGSYNYRTQQTGSDLYPQQTTNDYVQAQAPDYTHNAVPNSVQTRNTTQAGSYAQNPSLEYAQPRNSDPTNPNSQPTNNYTQPNAANYDPTNPPANHAHPNNPDYSNPNSQAGNYAQPDNSNNYRQPEGYAQPSNPTYDPNSRADTYAQPSNSTYDPASQAGNYAQPEGYAQQGAIDPTRAGYVDGQGDYTNPNVQHANPGNQTSEDRQRSDWARREKARTDNEREPQTREADANQNNY